jgi:hypothetical protein
MADYVAVAQTKDIDPGEMMRAAPTRSGFYHRHGGCVARFEPGTGRVATKDQAVRMGKGG